MQRIAGDKPNELQYINHLVRSHALLTSLLLTCGLAVDEKDNFTADLPKRPHGPPLSTAAQHLSTGC